MANILVQNQGLQSQLNSVNIHLVSLHQLMHSIQANATNTQPDASDVAGRRTNTPVRRPSRRANIPPTHYYWSHSGTINPNHTSMTCIMRKLGHDVTTILQDTKGGCRKFLDLLPGSTNWKLGQMHNASHDPLRNYIKNNLHNYLSGNPPSLNNQTCANNTNLAIAESGTTGNYLSTEAQFLNVKATTTWPIVIIP